MDKIVILGAGQAGGWCAKSLREKGFSGEIILVGDEGLKPYERPPLSKAVLNGSEAPESCNLMSDADYEALGLTDYLQDPAVAIDATARTVSLKSGVSLPYDKLVLAMGGQARQLPNLAGENVFILRNIEDSLKLKAAFASAKSLAVIGGGWIGLEVASTAVKEGLKVTVLEMQDRLCARSLPPIMSDYLADLHQRNGIDLKLDTVISSIENDGQSVTLTLEGNGDIQADLLLVGIGLIPNVSLAEAAGLDVSNGVVVDANWQSSNADIFAIGDLANRQNMRLESWGNAMKSAEDVAAFLMEGTSPVEEAAWFWSDQYSSNIQILGTPSQWGEPILRGDLSADQATVLFEENGQLVAAISVNQPNDIKVAKRLMARNKEVSRDILADESVNMKALLK